MSNIRTRTLWSINGRAPDSRDLWDDTGHGLKQGRVDIDGSLMVHTEGYKNIKYLRTDSQGNVNEYDSIMEALTVYRVAPVVETKPGSGIMTFFISDVESTYPGIFKVDVRKEWDEGEPDPEPELSPVDWPRQTLYAGTMGLGLDFVFKNGDIVSSAARGGSIINRLGQWAVTKSEAASFAKLVLKALTNADAADLAAIKKVLGIVDPA